MFHAFAAGQFAEGQGLACPVCRQAARQICRAEARIQRMTMWGRRARLALNRNTAGARAAYLRAVDIVSSVTGVPAHLIVDAQPHGRPRRRRGNSVSFARQAAIYLAVCGLDVRQGALARALGRTRGKVHEAVQAIENTRDCARHDELLTRMEAML